MNQMPLDLYKGHTSCMKRHETKSGLATESGKAFSLWDGGLLQLTPDPTQSIRPSEAAKEVWSTCYTAGFLQAHLMKLYDFLSLSPFFSGKVSF
ncbi:uncharacterized protein LOC126050152 isoform X4 [Accipiter gentilis]|uniref:uncharacterized protein LOC126050152 isoform X4 n=1 Tax=Astur gentilis TaxID=8957 RepID=UPI0021108232|nr:uncharacterized protein LOC126050152 isoform X4 [Accipiter gentilis]